MIRIDSNGLGHLQLQGMVQLRPDPEGPVLGKLDLAESRTSEMNISHHDRSLANGSTSAGDRFWDIIPSLNCRG